MSQVSPCHEETQHAAGVRAALLFFSVTHAVALAAMAILLRAGMDPAALPIFERARYVAQHAWRWRLGWLPWQLAALSNLWVGIALWRWAAQRKLGSAKQSAAWALGWFVLAALPEQWAEAMLDTSFVDAAKHPSTDWARDWALYAGVTGVWANLGYTVMVGCWMLCARRLCARAVLPASFELGLLCAFVTSAGLTLRTIVADAAAQGAWFRAASALNGLAFPALIGWSLAFWRRTNHAGGTPG